MRRKLFGLFTLLLLCLSVQAAKQGVTIQGRVENLGNEELWLLNVDQSVILKTRAQDGKFKMTAELETGDMRYYSLYAPSVGPLGPSMSIPSISFFVCAPDFQVEAVLADKKMRIVAIKGSPCNEEYNRLFDNLPANKAMEAALTPYNKAFERYNVVDKTPGNLKKLKEASQVIDQLYKDRQQQIMALIPTHRKSMPVAVMASLYCMSTDSVKQLETFLKSFDESIQQCYYLKQIRNKVNRLKSISIGQQAPDFELKDLNGKPVKLSSFRGKYVLLDFWASWCGPCRKENPNVVKSYDRYKNKGFTVLGVSLDADEVKWRQAVQEDGMPWVQTLDDKTAAGNAGKLYEIKAIPANFLIDTHGKIIATNLRGPELEKVLSKFIN